MVCVYVMDSGTLLFLCDYILDLCILIRIAPHFDLDCSSPLLPLVFGPALAHRASRARRDSRATRLTRHD
jgi:hypothetical protein